MDNNVFSKQHGDKT